MGEIDKKYMKQWTYIPENAFLYFPQGDQIKIEQREKQWRKIFENGQPYDRFEVQQLERLEERLKQKNILVDEWFDTPNKLRFLQANKFKVQATVESMMETTKWRSTAFPIVSNQSVQDLLNTGAFYFCGRDEKYRPIIVADISKFNPDQVQIIPQTLIILMEFMISQLLIEGQVQNYILIMNLEKASFSYRSVIMKILSFTSNAYRGRLFASYLLSMPSLIRWGWEALVSKLVSENTLKKIKISGDSYNNEMWTHISKNIIQKQYGGNMENMSNNFWPPNNNLMRFIQESNQNKNNLITKQKYDELYKQNKLKKRKINQRFIIQSIKEQSKMPLELEIQSNGFQNIAASQASSVKNSRIDESMLVFKVETSFIRDCPSINTFFKRPEFKKICLIQTK